MRDAAFAVVLTLVTQVELLLADGVEGPLLLQSAAFAVMTMSVAWRRTRPLAAAALIGGALAVQTLVGDAEVAGGFIALLVVTYSVGSYSDLRGALLGGLFIFAAVFIYPLVNDINFADEVGNLAIFFGVWTLGRAVRARQQRAVDAEHELAAMEAARDEQMRSIVSEERRRIARELHDIVAHGVSVMILQAGAARQIVHREPEQVPELLIGVETTGRQALDEMHHLLAVLRRDGLDDGASPPLRLSQLDGVIEDVRASGIAVDYRIVGEPRPLSPGLEASAYRIVQEALTNVLKHAGAGHVDVVVDYQSDAIHLSIDDDGSGASGDMPPRGHGIVGMRERAKLFGGSVTAGPDESGGWVVQARLPIDAAE
jgi:signal transduction histidine kinase